MRKHVRWQISSAKARGFTVKDLAAPEKAAETMVAAAPIAHPLDSIAGPFYDTDGLTTWLGISRQAVHKRGEAGSLLACRTADGRLVYPVFQFSANGDLLSGLRPVIMALREHTADDWTVAVWLATPAADLDGMSAADWLASGYDPNRPLQAAKADAARWAA